MLTTKRWGVSAGSIAVLTATVLLLSSAIAWASFNTSATDGATYSTATLSPATNLVAAQGPCTVAVAASVTLTWTATTSTWADGYEILRSLIPAGPFTSVATVSGRTTTTYTNGSLLFSTLYSYVVRATKAGWRSTNTNTAALTTLSALCT